MKFLKLAASCAWCVMGCRESEHLASIDGETSLAGQNDARTEDTLPAHDSYDGSVADVAGTTDAQMDDFDTGPPTCPDVTFDPPETNPWDTESSLSPCECYGCENPGAPYPACPDGERCDAGLYPYVSADYRRYQAPPATHGLCRHLCREYTGSSDTYPYCNKSALQTKHDCPETESCDRFDSYFYDFEMPFEESWGLCAKAL